MGWTTVTTNRQVAEMAAQQLGLVSRNQIRSVGMSEGAIQHRLTQRLWSPIHPGVYLIGFAPLTWSQKLMAACLAAGPHAAVSHRAAGLMWEIDGVSRALPEIVMPHGEEAVARNVLVHRSRKLDDRDVTSLGPLRVTRIERTLVDLGRYLSPRELEKALEAALRKRLTTPQEAWRYAEERGVRLPGRARLLAILKMRGAAPAAGSGGEVEFLRILRARGIPAPRRQWEVTLPSGRRALIDFAWPELLLAAEYDGYEFHGGRQAHADDLERQNGLIALGWTLLRYPGVRVRRDPTGVALEVESAMRRLSRAA